MLSRSKQKRRDRPRSPSRSKAKRAERELARRVARDLMFALRFWKTAAKIELGSAVDLDRPPPLTKKNEKSYLLWLAKDFFFEVGWQIPATNTSRFLRFVADHLDGTLPDYRVGHHDDKIEHVMNRLILPKDERGGLTFNGRACFADFKKAFEKTYPALRVNRKVLQRAIQRRRYRLSRKRAGPTKQD